MSTQAFEAGIGHMQILLQHKHYWWIYPWVQRSCVWMWLTHLINLLCLSCQDPRQSQPRPKWLLSYVHTLWPLTWGRMETWWWEGETNLHLCCKRSPQHWVGFWLLLPILQTLWVSPSMCICGCLGNPRYNKEYWDLEHAFNWERSTVSIFCLGKPYIHISSQAFPPK